MKKYSLMKETIVEDIEINSSFAAIKLDYKIIDKYLI